MEVDAPISTLFLRSDGSWTLERFPLMNALVALGPERGDADVASYPPYSFPGSTNDVSVILEHLLDNLSHTWRLFVQDHLRG